MDKYLIKNKPTIEETSTARANDDCSKRRHVEINLDDLPSDPGLRKKISYYHPNDRDRIRRHYLQQGPCQPKGYVFPQKKFGNIFRRFVPKWFEEHKNWLEYSIAKDAAFCLCCYLYRSDCGAQASSGEVFVSEEFTNWKKKEKFNDHVGGPDSAHNKALKGCEDLMNPKQNIQFAIERQSEQARKDYRLRLTASLDCIRFLLSQGLAFRGHNETEESHKRKDLLREKQQKRVLEALEIGELSTGTGSNQERSLQRGGDTRWGSHYRSLVSLSVMFSAVIDVLQVIESSGSSADQRGEAFSLLSVMQTFEFVFILHLMKSILGTTNELSLALQRKDQDIVNVVALVKVTKQRLQTMRDEGWDPLMSEVSMFCKGHDIDILNLNDKYVAPGRSRRNREALTNLSYFRFELFNSVIDWQLQELNNRFNEVNTDLLLCVASLSPKDSFAAFDKSRLIQLACFYPSEFSEIDIQLLDNQLETYIRDMRSHEEFSNIESIGDLSQKLVTTKKHNVYSLVYLLVKLALILPVATASVERIFSAMKIMKNRLRNKMGDSWINDCLVTYIEKDIFGGIDNERIFNSFQVMKTRKRYL